MGNLGQDPEIRMTQTGKQVCNISVAVQSSWKKPDGTQDPPVWFRVVLWDKMAETASKYLKKGEPVHIVGTFKNKEWTDPQGNKKTSMEVNATTMTLMGKSQKNDASVAVAAELPPSGVGSEFGNDDDVSF